jgi:hypothetical protein
LPQKSNLGIDLEKNGFRHGAISTSPSKLSDKPAGWHKPCHAASLAALHCSQSTQACEIKHNLAGNKAYLGRARMTRWWESADEPWEWHLG